MSEKIIEFILNPEIDNDLFPSLLEPVPASKLIGEWFKGMENFHPPNNDGGTPEFQAKRATVKMCMPVLDAMRFGYVLLLQADVEFQIGKEFGLEKGNYNYFSILDEIELIGSQDSPQIKGHPLMEKLGAAMVSKFMNPWIIKTPDDYSCLFTHPSLNDPEDRFHTMSGIVDTDKHFLPVHHPFIVNCKTYNNQRMLLERGTPICLVVPFKRDSWCMQARRPLDEDIRRFKGRRFTWGAKMYNTLKTFWRDPIKFK